MEEEEEFNDVKIGIKIDGAKEGSGFFSCTGSRQSDRDIIIETKKSETDSDEDFGQNDDDDNVFL